MSNTIDLLLKKLETFKKKLGVEKQGVCNLISTLSLTLKDEMKNKNSEDEFNNCKLQIIEDINYVRKKQEERTERQAKNPTRDIEVIRMNVDIKEKIGDIEIKVDELKKVLSRQRKKVSVTSIF